MFLFFIQVAFLHTQKVVAIAVNVRDMLVVDVGQSFALGDFVASKHFNFDPFVVL